MIQNCSIIPPLVPQTTPGRLKCKLRLLISDPPPDHHQGTWRGGGGLDFRNIRFEGPLALWSWITCCALFSEEGGGGGIWKHTICRYVELLCYIFLPPPQPAWILNPLYISYYSRETCPKKRNLNRHVRSQSLWEDWRGRKLSCIILSYLVCVVCWIHWRHFHLHFVNGARQKCNLHFPKM